MRMQVEATDWVVDSTVEEIATSRFEITELTELELAMVGGGTANVAFV